LLQSTDVLPSTSAGDGHSHTFGAASSTSSAGAVIVDSGDSDPDEPSVEIVEIPQVSVEGNFINS